MKNHLTTESYITYGEVYVNWHIIVGDKCRSAQ